MDFIFISSLHKTSLYVYAIFQFIVCLYLIVSSKSSQYEMTIENMINFLTITSLLLLINGAARIIGKPVKTIKVQNLYYLLLYFPSMCRIKYNLIYPKKNYY